MAELRDAVLALVEQQRIANLIALATLTEVDTDGDILRADAMDRLVRWVPDGPDDEHPEMRPEIAAALAVEAADAVLTEYPVLAGVTDEMVEAGARGLTRHYFAEEGNYNPCEAMVTAHTVEPIRDIARAVLEAAFGKEQGDE